jgi:subtilase family serine protease
MVVDVEGAAANIEDALHVKLGVYQHPLEHRTFYAPDREPSVDLDVRLLHISGLDNFALPHAKLSHAKNTHSGGSPGTGSGPSGAFIGSDLRAAYYGLGSLTGTGQAVGLFEFGGYNIADVQNYFKNVNQTSTVPVNGVSLNGVAVNCPKCEDSEQVLDIEIAASMAPGLSQIQVYVGSSDVSIFNQMAADNISKQLSCSWGWKDDESNLDPIFKEMMAQGQSVFVATGDDGSSTSGYDCY